MIKQGLQAAANPAYTNVNVFRSLFGNDELLEGLISKDYVSIDHNNIELTLKGVRALLDFENIDERSLR
jgi:hypothetical protein